MRRDRLKEIDADAVLKDGAKRQKLSRDRKKEVDEDCVVKTEVEDVGLPSNPFMVAANQLHNLKVIICQNFQSRQKNR